MAEIVVGQEGAGESKPTASRSNEVILTGSEETTTEPEKTKQTAPEENAPDPKEPTTDDTTNEGGDEDGSTETEPTLVVGDFDMSALAEEYTTTGKLSDESYAELAECGFSRDLVDTYIAGRKAQAAEGQALGERAQAEIFEVAGGEEAYNALIDWAENKLTQPEKEAYNKAVATGDVALIKLAAQGLKAKHELAYGRDPKLTRGGGKAPVSNPGFESQQEMMKAMSDPRYGRDPKYTKEVEQKTVNSTFLRPRSKRS